MVADEYGPWRGALLEDYELSLHLMMTGHRNEYTQDTWVDQEALPDLRRLVRQRTRWGQGTMQCGAYLRQLWSSRHVTKIGALEATYYLFQPWLQLIGTFVYPVPAIVFVTNYIAGPSAMREWVVQGGWMILAFYLVVGLGPFVLWGPVYRRRCEPGLGMAKALALGVGYSVFVLIFYVTSWRAFCRILSGRTDWSKTRRNAEFLSEVEPLPGRPGDDRAARRVAGSGQPSRPSTQRPANDQRNDGGKLMKATLKGASKLAASLTLAGGLLVAAALPAAAASPNRSNAAQATGLVSGGPLAMASFPGTSPVTVAHANITGILSTGVVTDTAGPTSASTRVANRGVADRPGGAERPTAVTSSCTFNTNTGDVTGTATISNGRSRSAGWRPPPWPRTRPRTPR